MRYLAVLILITISAGLFGADTTTVFLDYRKDEIKKKKAYFYQNITKKKNGMWFESIHLMDGTIQSTGTYSSKDLTTKNGHFIFYTINGKKDEEGNYVDDEKNGIWTTYYSSGGKKLEGVYANGERDSIWTGWHENGQLELIGSYEKGERVGEWNSYFSNGTLWENSNYNEEGEYIGTYSKYYKNGSIRDTGNYVDDKKVGEWKYYFKNGQVSCEAMYENGNEINSSYWNSDGSVQSDTSNVNRDPHFPGGEAEMYKFLGQNLTYPTEARDNNIFGRVYVSFVVRKDGSIEDIRILRGVHPLIDEVSLNVIEKMPDWIPGIDHNRIISVKFNLPILFSLQ